LTNILYSDIHTAHVNASILTLWNR